MKFTLHNVKETKRVFFSVEAKNEEEAVKSIKNIARALEKCISKKWKYEIISTGLTETFPLSNYFVYLTFEISSHKINKTIEHTEKEMEEY